MAFDKLIVNTVVKTTKDSIKFEKSIEKLKLQILNRGNSFIQNNNIIKISFPKDINEIENLDSNLIINNESLSKIGEIPNTEKLLKDLEEFEKFLNDIIGVKNGITNALFKTQAALDNTRKTADTIKKFVIGIEVGISILKKLPIPTAFPPGIGMPLGVINTLSDILDTLNDVIKKGRGPISQIPSVLNNINGIINNIIIKINSLDSIILYLINLITLLKTLSKYGPNATQDEINEVTQEVADSINLQLLDTDFSPQGIGNESQLLKCLESNSNNPCIYKDFILTIEYNPNNPTSLNSRRIKGFNPLTNQTIYNNFLYAKNNPEGYSFSTSLQILIDEIIYAINSFTNQNNIEDLETLIPTKKYTPFEEPGKDNEVRPYLDKFYKFNISTDSWEIFAPDLSPFGYAGNIDGQEMQLQTTDEETLIEEKRKRGSRRKYFVTTIKYKVFYISYYVWNNFKYMWEFKDKEILSKVEKSRVTKLIKI
jgi:hypothetical protein